MRRRAHRDVAANPDRFRPVAEALVAEARQARQPEALALALRALAWAERARLNDVSAILLLDEACRIARRHHLDATLADLLMSRAGVRQELGRFPAARRDLAAAAALVTGAGRLDLDFNRGVLLQNSGRLADAAAIYHRLLGESGISSRRRAECANNLALIEAEQGRFAAALRRLAETPGAAEIGPALTAGLTQTRAWVTMRSGRFAEGLRVFEEAAQAYRAAALSLGEHYIEYADALMELRLLPEATGAARRAAAEFSDAGIPLMAAEAQLRVAQLALLTGDHDAAVRAATAAAAAFRRQTRAAFRARAVVVAAEARLQAGTGGAAGTAPGARRGPAARQHRVNRGGGAGLPGDRAARRGRSTGAARRSRPWPGPDRWPAGRRCWCGFGARSPPRSPPACGSATTRRWRTAGVA